MIISTPEEMRLFSPSNAIDNIDSLAGFINSSEADFLKEKLGAGLYASIVAYYNSHIRGQVDSYISQMRTGDGVPAYAQLLYLAQKVVTYDALSRYVNIQAVSINGAGVNVASAEDYKAADAQAISDFKKACVKEAHSAVNEMLQQLEQWAMDIAIAEDLTDLQEEKEIVDLWRQSRYFYKVAELIIPNAIVLQEFYNIYDSREKFIQMLPDLRYIQDDILAPIYGDDLVEYLADFPWQKHDNEPYPKHTLKILTLMRKITARYLETRQLKATDPRHIEARNEAMKLTDRLNAYLQAHQGHFDGELKEAFSTSPLWVNPDKPEPTPAFENNAPGNVIFATPGLI